MKTNWQTKKLGDIGKVSMCKRVFKDQTTKNGNIPFYKIGTFGKEPDAYISNEIYDEFRKKFSFPKKGDILISASGTIGRRVRYNGEPAYFQDSNIVWIDNDERQVLNDYLYYFYEACNWNSTKGTTISRLYNDNLKQIEISFPQSLQEQKRIINTLENIFEKLEKVKENTEKNLQNSKELFESYLNDFFSNPGKDWKERRLDYVCEISSTLIDPKKKEYLEMLHIGAGNMVTKSEVLIDLKTAKQERLVSGKFLFDTTMVLYSKIRPYLMKVVRPKFDGLCSADIYPLKPLEKMITRDFLFYVLLSKDFTDYAIKGSARAGMPKVNREHLFAYTFYLPSISEQNKIVKRLDQLSEKIKKLESLYKQKLENIEELKKSILSKAFSKGL